MIGLRDGVCQANHGNEAPLKRMSMGDGVIFYSPKEIFGGNEKCQKFTAIGKIKDNEIYQFKMTNSRVPFRRKVEFYPSKDVDIRPLIESLSFIKNKKSWGYAFRFGMIQIPHSDFEKIKDMMLS